MKYKLHTGIKAVIDSNGNEVLNTMLLSNILADYGAFEDYPTTKVVLRDILAKGYGKKICDGIKYNASTKNVIENIKKEFKKKTNYKKDIVDYVFDSIAFALGVSENVSEPFSSGFDPYASESDGILDRLQDMLAELKRDYTESLNKLLVKPNDLVWDAPAYYTADAENKLYLIEGKILIITKQLGLYYDGWCKKQKSAKLTVYSSRKQGAVKELLDAKKAEYKSTITKAFTAPSSVGTGKSICFDNSKLEAIKSLEDIIASLYKEKGENYDKWCEDQKSILISSTLNKNKKDYLELLKKALTIPHSKIISKSAYFTSTYTKDIEDKEHLIVALYNEMGSKYDNWCENEKEALLKPHLVSKAKQIRQGILKIALPLVIVGSGTSQYISYNSSTEEIARYETAISQADAYMSQGNYGQAIEKYIEAGNNYNGSYNPSSYQAESRDKADACFENMKTAVEQQLSNKKYKLVRDELKSLSGDYVSSDAQKSEWVNKEQSQLKETVDKELETVINKIASNNGHLDADGRKFLDELMYVSPDNYWFKVIKSKEQ